MSDTVTGNPNRDLMILNVIADAQAAEEPITAASLSVGHGLPDDFDLLPEEVSGVQAKLAELDGNVNAYVAHLVAAAFEGNAEPANTEQATDITPEMAEESVPLEAVVASDDTEPKTMEEGQDMLAAANEQLAQARGHVLTCQQRERDARERLATAITEFQTGLIKLTPEQLLRDNARHQAEMRRAVAEGKADAPKRVSVPGPSVIDRQAFYSRGGSANYGHGKKWLGRTAKWNTPAQR